MSNVKLFYWIYVIAIFIEVLNLILKVFNPYYFNLFVLAIVTVNTAFLGKNTGIKIGWIVTFTILTLLLLILMMFVVWN